MDKLDFQMWGLITYFIGVGVGIFIGGYNAYNKKCPCCSYPKCGHAHEGEK